jgi:uncharacterized membrane protein YphA (DoxX/SURF4 family)
VNESTALWVGQILLAIAFIAVGFGHSVGFESTVQRRGMGWLLAVGRDRMRIIGGLEVVGGVGLIVPGATGVLPWLTPVAAACLAVLMAIAAVFHVRRSGEGANVVNNVMLLVIATLVAYGRFVVSPF